MRVLVCGGRDYKAVNKLNDTLDLHVGSLIGLECIITGGAIGADVMAEMWARNRGVRYVVIPALWDAEGKAAGVLRNQAMLDIMKPDLVIAFPGGRGTADMVRRSLDAGIKVVMVK